MSSIEGTGKVVAQGVATTGVVTIYGPITSSNQHLEIKGLVLCNESAGATTVSYGVGISGSTAGAAGTAQGKTVPIGAAGSSTHIIDASELEEVILGAGDYVWVQAGANTAVSYTLDGVVYS